jgi:hypothetical protein
MRLRTLTGILAILASFSGAIAQDRKDAAYLKNLSCTEGPYRLHLPATYQAVRSIGQLREEKVLEVRDWDTYKTEYRRLVFNGLQLEIATFTNDESRYLVAGVLVTSPGWSFAGGFRVGDSIDNVETRLGIHGAAVKNEINVSGDADALRFGISRGKVSRIVYECYTG